MKLFLDFCGDLNMYSYGNDYNIFEENYNLYKLKNKLNQKNLKIRPYFEKYKINTNNYIVDSFINILI